MFNIGFSELLILGLIALIFLGPQQLPEVARSIGRLVNEWRRGTSDFQNTITTHLTDKVQQGPSGIQQDPDEFAKHIGTPVEPTELPAGAHPVSEDDPEKKS